MAQYYNVSKVLAVKALKEGHKVSHCLFGQNEYISMNSTGDIVTEDGIVTEWDIFWRRRMGRHWETGWEIFKYQ